MTSLNTQFHCLPHEFVNLLVEASKGAEVSLVIVSGRPFSAKKVAPEKLEIGVQDASKEKASVSIFIVPADAGLKGSTRTEFYDLNPEIIIADVGLLTKDGLRQASISAKTSNLELEKVVKKIKKLLKSRTIAGVTAVNVDTNHRKLWKNYRFSSEALALEKSGVGMLPFAGGVKLLLGDQTK